MATRALNPAHRPRELRRRVVVPARLRAGAAWSDACILNISSRGLLIHSHRPTPQGSIVELHRGEHVITARVIWRDGSKAGLQAEDRVPIEEIVTLAQAGTLRLSAGESRERRKRARQSHDSSRLRGRAVEFISIAVIAVSLAGMVGLIVEEALARPLAAVKAALGG